MIARDSTTDAASVDVVDAAMSTAARRSAFPWRSGAACRSGWRRRVITGTDRCVNSARVPPAAAPQATLRP